MIAMNYKLRQLTFFKLNQQYLF